MTQKLMHLSRLMLAATLLSAPLAGFVGRIDVAAAVPRPEPALDVLPAWMPAPLEDQPPPASPTLSEASSTTAVAPGERAARPSAIRGPMAIGDVIEVFTNTWSYSTIGLVYDPGRDLVRYAHESQSSSHNPTIYDVEYAPSGVTRTVLFSVALSTKNSGWPWQIDNRNGAGYDFVEDTYFLPDYNGDLSYADDNIVEVRPDGTILNAWEMDDEVGSNDSSDGSEIDSIIDIAVVPGNPTRYFATAAYDDNVVYEIELTKTGTWWTPNSWRTVATCTVPGWSVTDDNLGIDYDAENERLYHSSWHTTTIVATDLTCQNGQTMTLATDDEGTPIQPFDCPGAGGYNSGVTFIEGATRPEVWVTDFSSDQTTRCEAPGGEMPPDPGWSKWIDGIRYDPDIAITRQLSDVIQITDVITAVDPFTLTESWDPERLALVGMDVYPPAGQIVTGAESLQIIGAAGPPEVVTVTKWFHVEPCDWLTTTLREELEIAGVMTETRPVVVRKEPPILELTSASVVSVSAGSIASFTLTYANTGGFENDVWISNTFPITAPFAYADPFPDAIGPDGLWARWDVGDLANDAKGTIDVYVFISETLPPSTWVTIWDGIYDHMGVLQDETWIEFHVMEEEPPPIIWEKIIDGRAWRPGVTVTRQTSDTFVVEEVIDPQGYLEGFTFSEAWNPDELALWDWHIEPDIYRDFVITTTGFWALEMPPSPFPPDPVRIFKEFHIEPCTWTETILWESLATLDGSVRNRPVLVNKQQPDLHLESFYDEPAGPDVYSREEVTFTLAYSNTGGYESDATITNVFPSEAPFVRSDPPPNIIQGEDITVTWRLTEGLQTDERGTITVTVRITEGLPPSTTIEIWDGIYNHAGELQDDTVIAYHVPPPEWRKWVNGVPWEILLGATVETSDTITVTDVISTRSAVALTEHWNPEQLSLTRFITDATAPGIILSGTDHLYWEFPGGGPGVMTITKWFHIEPGELITQGVGGERVWADTILWEELWVEDVEWDRHPVFIDKFHPDLHLESAGGGEVVAGRPATFTLSYINTGGYENDAWITNTFPLSAPFASASVTPTRVADDGAWAAWRIGPLENSEEGFIEVTVDILSTLVASETIEIWDGIYHDGNVLITDTVITYHVTQPPYTWAKWIDDEPWREGLTRTVETSDTVRVVDVIATEGLFELVEYWNAEELALVEWAIDPPWAASEWVTETGAFIWRAPPAGDERPEVITLTKFFHVEPCDWMATSLQEELVVQQLEHDERWVRFEKLPPELSLTSEGGGDVYAGGQGRFTLHYANAGGRENDVVITNTFPITAPFAWADPDPAAVDPDGRWARWELGEVDQGVQEAIEVAVALSETLPPSTTIEVWDGIYDHLGRLVSETWTTFHIVERPPITWHKTINGLVWTPDLRVAVETFDPLTVTDAVIATQPFTLTEAWDGARITFLEAELQPPDAGRIITGDGWLTWVVTPTEPGAFTLTKHFHTEPCTWTETIIHEQLVAGAGGEERAILIEKRPSQLHLDHAGGGDVYAGQLAGFTLIYSNTGGLENGVAIRNEFPPEAPFVSAEPPPVEQAPDGSWVEWDVGDLPAGGRDEIDVTVDISSSLVASDTIEIWDGIYNHVDELVDETVVRYHVTQPPYTWTKWIDDEAWREGVSVTVETSDTVRVVDVVATIGAIELTERWMPGELALVDWAIDPPEAASEWVTETGALIWYAPPAGDERPEVITLTKWFHVEPCTWTATLLEEALSIQQAPVEHREVRLEKLPPALWLESAPYAGHEVFAGGVGRFTLVYSNTGGRENDVVITNTFPITAPFAWADPEPAAVDPDGRWARWELGEMDRGARGAIEVTVAISEAAPPSSTLKIWDGIYNHVGELMDETVITYHVQPPPPVSWAKWIDEARWQPGIALTFETSDTLTVIDVITAAPPIFPLPAYSLTLKEAWAPLHLDLVDVQVEASQPDAGEVITDSETGSLVWIIAPESGGIEPVIFTMTKLFHVAPCTWTATLLEEDLMVQEILLASRPVPIEKWAPELHLDHAGGGEVVAGQLAAFTLVYSNTGGYENDVWIENEFPPEAPFVSSSMTPTQVATDATWVRWDVGDLAHGARGEIEVTVAISDALAPCNWITITDWIYNHAGEPVDETAIRFHVGCVEVTGVTLSYTPTGDIYTDTVVHFSADIAPDEATKPYTTTIDYGDGVSHTITSSDDPLLLDHTFDTTGTFTVEIAARNCDMVEPVTDTITVTVIQPPEPPPQCIPVTGVDLTLEAASTILIDSVVRFRADIHPDDADKPYTYTIDYGDETITTTTASADPLSLAHTYAMTGTFTVEIAAWNCDMTKPVTASLTLTVHPPDATFSHIYLPLVMRGD